MNYKPRYNMAAKKTPKTEADKAGMSNLLSQVRKKREQATGGCVQYRPYWHSMS